MVYSTETSIDVAGQPQDLYGYPATNPSKSYWIEEFDSPLKKYQDPNGLTSEADVVIIGSGFTGTSVASNLLLEHSTTKSVVLLEARDVCSAATGRNGGHIRSDYHRHQKEYIEKYGAEVAADLCNFEHLEMQKVQDLVEKYGIECYFERRESCETFPDIVASRKEVGDYYSFMANPYIPQEIKDTIQVYFGKQATEISDHNTTAAIIAPTASVWPYRLVTALLKKCIDNGLSLHTNTPVIDVTKTDGGKWKVDTSRGTITAAKVVIATNAYTKALLPEFKGLIVPVKGSVTHLKPTFPDPPKLKYNYLHMNPLSGDYVTVRQDNSLVAGGASLTFLDPPESLRMINNANDSYVPQCVLDYFKGYTERNYISLAGKKYDNDYTWTGVMGYTDDEFPYVGDLTSYGRANMYISAGYTGHGMPRIWSCGSYIADLIEGREPTHIPEPYKLDPSRFGYGAGWVHEIVKRNPLHDILLN